MRAMARLCVFTGALLVSRVIANAPSCQQADETTLLQGFVRHRGAQSLQPQRADAVQSLHSVQSQQRSLQIPNPDAQLSAWAAQHPILALKLGEVPPDEVVNVVDDAEFVPEVTEAINEFIDEHGGAAFQEWVRGVLSPQFSYPEPDLPDFTVPTEFTALFPLSQTMAFPGRMATVVLDETIYGDVGGRVIDGSMAQYYYRPGTGNSNLLVFHQDGGGSCGTDENAQFQCNDWFPQKQQRNRQGDWTGKRRRFVIGDFDGNLPGHLDDNHPDFGSAHKIRVPYLSGDAFMGQVVSPSNPCQSTFAEDGSYVEMANFTNCDMYQSGHLNIRNIMHHFLSNQPGSRDITRIFMTGNSAGGRSSLMNCDWLQEFMDTHGPRLGMQHVEVSCAPVAGFMLPGFTADHENPKSPPTPFPLWRIGEVRTDEEVAVTMGSSLNNTKSWLPRACRVAQVSGEEWMCGSATVAYPLIVPRVFIVQNKYDYMTKWMKFPMGAWNWPTSLLGEPPEEDASITCEGQEYMRYYGDAMNASMVAAKPQDGMFFASCIDHHENNELGGEAITSMPWSHHENTLVQGVDSLQAVTNWFFEKGELLNEIRDDCQSPMGVPCNPSCKKKIQDLGPSCL